MNLRLYAKDLLLYTGLTLGGLLVDLTVANTLIYLFSFHVMVGGAFGLLAGAITNYFIHITITFRHRFLSPSWKNFFKYLQTCLFGAGCRLFLLALFAAFSDLPSYLSLILATGLSFLVNYLLAKFYVFKDQI